MRPTLHATCRRLLGAAARCEIVPPPWHSSTQRYHSGVHSEKMSRVTPARYRFAKRGTVQELHHTCASLSPSLQPPRTSAAGNADAQL
eukprot:scaffold59887_cov42-Phaeocystis_antarctica.AAC.2